jgi:hypothetical protein
LKLKRWVAGGYLIEKTVMEDATVCEDVNLDTEAVRKYISFCVAKESNGRNNKVFTWVEDMALCGEYCEIGPRWNSWWWRRRR